MTKIHKPWRGVYVMTPAVADEVYGPDAHQRIAHVVDMAPDVMDASTLRDHLEVLRDVNVIVSSWGGPKLDEELLDAAPDLRVVFYGAGSIRSLTTDAFWARDIPIVTARDAIADRVAEFTVSLVALSLKHLWHYERGSRDARQWMARRPAPGTVGSTVGLVSLGAVGRKVAGRLSGSEVSVVAYDPYADPARAEQLGVRLLGLDELFATSDVVSLHTPVLAETVGLAGHDLLTSMKPGATLINTARGRLVDHDALASVLAARPDLAAVLDVTDPEPLPSGSPLYELANVVITPHIAGNVGPERRALGRFMADEIERFARGEPLRHVVSAGEIATSA